MQTLACNLEGKLVQAEHATRKTPYTCLECGALLALRAGHRRRPHFYHLGQSVCRLQTRSTFHVEIQNFLQQQLLPWQTFLEHPFPSIARIADICVPEKKWIFEIQCSPISAMEVENRMRNYASCGYQVIWILFDKRFKRPYLSSAELFLQSHPYYFISKELTVYQQLFHIAYGKRISASKRFPIHLKTLDLNLKREWTPNKITQKKERQPILKPLLLRLLEKMCS